MRDFYDGSLGSRASVQHERHESLSSPALARAGDEARQFRPRQLRFAQEVQEEF